MTTETHPIDTSPEAIAALLDGVTPGPWKYVPNGKKTSITDCDYDRLFIASGTTAPYCDANFIAAARELVPALAAEIARLTAERDEARAQVARWQADATLMLGFAQLAYDAGAAPSSSELLAARDRTLAARDAALRNEGRRQAAAACDWGDIYGGNAVSVILAALEPEGGE